MSRIRQPIKHTTIPYPLSFTAAALLPEESATLAALYVELGDWEKAFTEIERGRLFNREKAKTRRRLYNELKLRLKTLGGKELELVAYGSDESRKLLLWQAVCRTYPFVGNFTRKVLRPKVLSYNYHLLYADYAAFWREEAVQHPRLEELTEATRAKIRSRLFYFLTQIGILTAADKEHLQALIVSPSLCTCVRAQNPAYLEFWLL